MHYKMLITTDHPAAADSAEIRSAVFDRLMEDDSFCGEGGRFGSPLCDWFVIGGRWSGLLAETLIGSAFEKAVHARIPELAGDFWPKSLVDRNRSRLDKLWHAHGGTGPSPYTRSGYEHHGYPDDAMLLTSELYQALLPDFVGESYCKGYADLDEEALSLDFIGRKWLIVIDYHS